jgi:hypothetical protein
LGSTGHPAGSNVGIAYTMWTPTFVSTRFWGYTDASGAFKITGLAAGTYVVQVQGGNIRPYQDEYTVATAAGGLSPVQPTSGQVTVSDGQPSNIGELIMTKARTISGIVTVDGAPASSNNQSTEVLLELDYQVPGSSTWTFTGLGYTDAVGHYSIDSVPRETGDLPVGRYRIFAQGAIVPAYIPVTQEFDVLPATANFDLPFGTDVTGLVWSGRGVDWNEVSITLTSGSRTMTRNAIAGGTFDIRLVPRGTWTLTAAYLSGNGTPFTTTFSVVNTNVVIPQIDLTPMPTIRGVVKESDSGYLGGMAINAFEYDPITGTYVRTISTTTDGNGFYQFMDVVPGKYSVESYDPNHRFATMDYLDESPYYGPDYVDAASPFPYEADITMPLAAHIQGTVHGPTPAEFAAGNVTAEVEVLDYSSGNPMWTATGDIWPVSADGSYDVGDLPPDDYRLKFTSDGTAIYPPVTTPTVTVAEGQSVTNVDVTLAKAVPGSFGSLPPSRLLDTRIGLGASGAVAGHGVLSLQVTGRGGVPASGVSSVVLNVTVAGSSTSGFVTAYPGGTPWPVASNLNFAAGQIVPNLVVVPVGADGTVNLYNGSSAPIQLVADIAGYYLSGGP